MQSDGYTWKCTWIYAAALFNSACQSVERERERDKWKEEEEMVSKRREERKKEGISRTPSVHIFIASMHSFATVIHSHIFDAGS